MLSCRVNYSAHRQQITRNLFDQSHRCQNSLIEGRKINQNKNRKKPLCQHQNPRFCGAWLNWIVCPSSELLPLPGIWFVWHSSRASSLFMLSWNILRKNTRQGHFAVTPTSSYSHFEFFFRLFFRPSLRFCIIFVLRSFLGALWAQRDFMIFEIIKQNRWCSRWARPVKSIWCSSLTFFWHRLRLEKLQISEKKWEKSFSHVENLGNFPPQTRKILIV